VIIGGSPVAIPAPRPAPDADPVAPNRAMDPSASAVYANGPCIDVEQVPDADWAYARMLYDFHLAPGNLFERLAFAMFDAAQEVPA
jgi:hypothetical protein